jgi:ABC-type transport system involved in multi-copper enzyme maturation permease subunit
MRWFQNHWFKLFGPVLLYDLVRTARRKQQAILRCLYGGFLLGMFYFVYAIWFFGGRARLGDLFSGMSLEPAALANFGFSFFMAFLVVQFVTACLLTPAWTAGAVTEEKESRTLEFLLATDLRSQEIVLSLTVSRLANLALVVLTGLPVLAMLQFLGGVDPNLLLAGFAFTGLSMVSLTGLGILVSVYAHHPRQAILRTYAWALVYLVVSGLSWLLLLPVLGWATSTLTAGTNPGNLLEEMVSWLNAGNPVAVAVLLWRDVEKGCALDEVIPGALGKYALAHLLATLVFVIWAVVRLRAVSLSPPPGPVKGALPLTRGGFRPRPCHPAILWKEVFLEPGLQLRRFGRIALGVLVPVSFLPTVGILHYFYLARSDWGRAELAEAMNVWVRIVGTLVACGMLLAIGMRAASSVSRERERHTLDSLLGTSASSVSILAAKWFGAIAGSRRAWLWLGLIWAVGIATGGLDFRAVPALMLTWLVVAAFFASMGVWLSVICRTTQRALLSTVVAAFFFTAGHWLLWIFALPVIAMLRGADAAPPWLLEFQAMGMTPALTLGWLAYPAHDIGPTLASDWTWAWAAIRQAPVFWLAGAVFFWMRAVARFHVSLGRGGTSTWSRRLVFAQNLVVVSVVAMIGWLITRGDGAAERLRDAVTEADLLDPGWRLDELEAKRKAIPEERNSTYQVPAIPDERRVLGSLPWHSGSHWPPRDLVQALKDLAPEVQLSERQLRLLTEGLEDVENALVQARRLVDFPEGRNPITYSRDGIGTLLPWTHRPHSIAMVLGYDVLLRAQEGDIDGALASCRAMINAGRILGDEPTFISMLVRITCRAHIPPRIERSLAQGQASEGALASLQRQLEQEESEPLLLVGARGERAIMDRFMQFREEGRLSGTSVLAIQQMYGMKLSLSDWAILLTGLNLRSQRAALLRFSNQIVEIAKQPLEEQYARLQELKDKAPELPPVARALAGPDRSWVIEKGAETYRRSRACLRCAIALIALERYRLAHGAWPESLDALTPKFLSEVPKDPYDGRLLRYRRLPDGVVVYSIGQDGQDNGGTKLRRGERIPTPEEGVDEGFRLWDVSQRRQAPKKTGYAGIRD